MIQIDPESDKMVKLKSQVDDRFYNHVLSMFDALGAISQEITRDFSVAHKESR